MNAKGLSIAQIKRSHIPDFEKEYKLMVASDLVALRWRIDKALELIKDVPDGAVIDLYQMGGELCLSIHGIGATK